MDRFSNALYCIMRKLIATALLVVLAGSVANAQSLPPTLRYFCDFDRVADPDGVKPTKDFKLEFLLETASGKGIIIGNQGFSKVHVVNGPSGITFLEPLGTGVVQTTTITNTDWKAVHSRHSIIGKALVPSQYYGSCVVEGKE